MLGLDGLAAVARAGEDAARLWREQSSQAAARICVQSLDTIEHTLSVLSGLNTGNFTRQAGAVVAQAAAEPMRAQAEPMLAKPE